MNFLLNFLGKNYAQMKCVCMAVCRLQMYSGLHVSNLMQTHVHAQSALLGKIKDVGCLSNRLWIKKVVLIPHKVLSFKRFVAEAFAVLFRVLS